jgi:hypothetical protein
MRELFPLLNIKQYLSQSWNLEKKLFNLLNKKALSKK